MIHTTKIYLVTNCYGDPNKVYIGKTKNCRKSAHKKTYGENIEYSYIDEVNSLNRMDWEPLETYWIQQFTQWGFEIVNLNKKGGGGSEYLTEETKQKIGKIHQGRTHTDETKQYLSLIRKGKPQPNISSAKKGKTISKLRGLKRSQETKDKMSENRVGIPNIQPSNYTHLKSSNPKPIGFGENISKKNGGKPIGKYSLIGELIQMYPYTEIAAIENKINPANLRAALKGRQLTSGGFIWKYI